MTQERAHHCFDLRAPQMPEALQTRTLGRKEEQGGEEHTRTEITEGLGAFTQPHLQVCSALAVLPVESFWLILH